MKCPRCASVRVYPSRLRNSFERLRQKVTDKQPYRCHECSWRKWRDVEFMTASPDVRLAARDYLVYAAFASVIGVFAFAYDGIYIGATWTRDMRNLMILSLALYFAAWWLTRSLGNAGLWIAILTFFGTRGALQAVRYPALARRTFKPATPLP